MIRFKNSYCGNLIASLIPRPHPPHPRWVGSGYEGSIVRTIQLASIYRLFTYILSLRVTGL